jgi:ElaB/YqjD/DUF883 family membrane-anchored ribosome-binding protein
MTSKSVKKNVIKNGLEAVLDRGDATGIAKGVGKSLVQDLALDGGKDFLSFLGLDTASSSDSGASKSQNTQENYTEHASIDIVNFKQQRVEQKAQRTEQSIEAAIDYHRDVVRSSERISKQELSSMNSQIQEILTELRSLIGSSRELSVEFAEISMEQAPTNLGVYHKNFFDWMLTMIRQAKQKVEDSAAWLGASKGKSGKKGYWGMFKKHGTSFAMSNERNVATQVG